MAQTNFTAKVTEINEKEQVTDRFAKQEIICEEHTSSPYASTYKVQAINAMIDRVGEIGIGDVVYFTCDVAGRRVEKEDGAVFYYVNLSMTEFKVIDKAERGGSYDHRKDQQMRRDEEFDRKYPDKLNEPLPTDDQDDLPF